MLAQPQDYATNKYNIITGLLRWRPWIEKICWRYKTLKTYTDIVQEIESGNKLWFDNGLAFAIIHPDQRTLGLLLHIWGCGGSRQGLYALEDQLIQFARQVGARQITALGRSGFKFWEHGTLKATQQRCYVMEL